MAETNNKNVKDPLVELYQNLDIDQCVELYLKQKDNMNVRQRTAAKIIIASKYIYGEKYIPDYGRKVKEEQKI